MQDKSTISQLIGQLDFLLDCSIDIKRDKKEATLSNALPITIVVWRNMPVDRIHNMALPKPSTLGVEKASEPVQTKTISWKTFLELNLTRAIEDLSPHYEKDFQDFLKRHPEAQNGVKNPAQVRTEFMKARILFEALKYDGRWGLDYQIPDVQVLKKAPLLMQEIANAAAKEDGMNQPYLFTGDCDDSDFLYAELGTTLGLKGIRVEMVQASHVNVFVPVGGALLRMDLTPICTNAKRPSWDLPSVSYTPSKDEKSYAEKILRPANRSYKAGKNYYAKQMESIVLNVKAVDTLLIRLGPPISSNFFIAIPDPWMPFAKTYIHTRACYKTFVQPYTFKSAHEASEASMSLLFGKAKAEADEKYLLCIENKEASPSENLGKSLSSRTWAGCASSQPAANTLTNGCFFYLQGQYRSAKDELKTRFHNSDEVNSDETRTLAEKIKYLRNHDPMMLNLPSDNLDFNTYWAWIENNPDRQLIMGLAALAHLLDYHPFSH